MMDCFQNLLSNPTCAAKLRWMRAHNFPWGPVTCAFAAFGGHLAAGGITLVHYSTQRKRCLWDTLGAFSRWMGHNSSQTERKTAH